MIEAPEKMFSAGELPPVDPDHPVDEIHQAVLNLHAIAKNLRAQRFTGGALRLDQVSAFKHLLVSIGWGKNQNKRVMWMFYLVRSIYVDVLFLFNCS